ncbi:unnamed protein product [Angiostrongylus costaricensis]|uniref:IMS_C domain-containing protein n=1 Tax=Angiostrongylus costaricensis TaxID=334426 RepID=A0A158PD92_ANGCS|nr:unnamed protein product [Angiostrongylus costaricensis]
MADAKKDYRNFEKEVPGFHANFTDVHFRGGLSEAIAERRKMFDEIERVVYFFPQVNVKTFGFSIHCEANDGESGSARHDFYVSKRREEESKQDNDYRFTSTATVMSSAAGASRIKGQKSKQTVSL